MSDEEKAREREAARQKNLAALDRLESEARLALANVHGDPSSTAAYAAIIRRCAERRARLLG